ncbi:MAG TPA: ethanolamine utilization protein [Lachnospiraceae bacterium]|nr:ethanolamine utilization protein [Lachnospiraceae bacterium]
MGEYNGAAVGAFETDSYLVACVAVDAAVKAADVKVEGVERNRLGSGACVKLRGRISDVRAAMDAAEEAARRMSPVTKSVVIPAPTEGTEKMLQMTIRK